MKFSPPNAALSTLLNIQAIFHRLYLRNFGGYIEFALGQDRTLALYGLNG
jgi:hypothetical protein